MTAGLRSRTRSSGGSRTVRIARAAVASIAVVLGALLAAFAAEPTPGPSATSSGARALGDGAVVPAAATPPAAAEPPVLRLDPLEVEGVRATAYGPVDGYVAYDSLTATKTDTPLIETPQSISVVTRDQMDAQNVQSVAEALRYAANVAAAPYGVDARFDWVLIRGFDQSGSGFYLDGLKQQFGFLGFRTEPYSLERVEVLRGPASVLYGQVGPGGIVNQVSKRPSATPSYAVELAGGTFHRYQGAADVTGSIGESAWSYRLTTLVRKSDTQVQYVDDDRAFVAPQLAWRPTDDTDITLLTSYLNDEFGLLQFLPVVGTVEPNPPYGRIPRRRFTGEPDFDDGHREQVLAGYLARHRIDDTFTLRQNMRFGHLDYLEQAVYAVGFAPDRQNLLRIPYSDRRDATILLLDTQAQAKWSAFGLDQQTLLGVDYARMNEKSINRTGAPSQIDPYAPVYGATITTPLVIADTDTTQDQVGLYAQNQLKLLERFVLLLGGRYDWLGNDVVNRTAGSTTEQPDQKFTGRVGLVALFDAGLAPYASFATSFEQTPGPNFYGELFVPTTGRQWELGVKYEPPGVNAFVTLALFDLTQQNVLTPDPLNPLNSIQIGEVRSRGVEIEGVATLADGLSLVASYSYDDVKTVETTDHALADKRPVTVPDQLASSWLDYTVPIGDFAGLGGGVGVRFVGSSFANEANTVTVPGYTLGDAAIHYATAGWRLAVNATNLADAVYATCSSEIACFYGQRRTILASVRYGW